MPMFPIPKFFRILIIDDLIGKNKAYQDLIENIFFSLFADATRYDKNFNFEICFTGRPDNGLKLWQDEIFDLTLIDADFTQYKQTGDDDSDTLSYALNSRYQGIHILSLLKRFVQKKEKYFYRNKNCEFYLWSGLSEGDIKEGLKAFKLEDEISKSKRTALTDFHNIIKRLVAKINKNKLESTHRIERLLFALKNNYNNIQNELFGGCLICDQDMQFDFLSKLTKINIKIKKEGEEKTKETTVHICPARIPAVVLKEEKRRFLPLHRRIFEGNLRDSIRYFLNEEKNDTLKKYCKQLTDRNKQVPKNLPFFPKSPQKVDQKEKLLRFPVKNQFIASATPLTGISVIGENRAREALKGKVKAMLDGPFGAVILKTTYLDDPKQWENVFWPGLQIQSHMRARCLYPDTGTPTLWNTGRTAVEMLPPASLNKFLLDISKDEQLKDDTHRIIISMGSKFPQTKSLVRCYRNELEKILKEIWKDFFDLIFKDFFDYSTFPIIEINVRHYLREIIEYYLGGDEYLNPLGFEQKNEPDIEGFWNEFQIWLRVIHDLAVIYNKRLILKFPHRSDVLAYVRCAVALRELHLATCKEEEREYGIRGITLVNTLKSPVPEAGSDHVKSISKFSNIPFTPDWYANPDAWRDAQDKKFKYQMSGRFVGPYRNQILAGISSEFDRIKNLGMEIFVSGGITSRKDVEFIQALSQQHSNIITGIQIGTWGLLNTELSKGNWGKVSEPSLPASPDYIPYKVDVSECIGGYNETLCPHGALVRGEDNKLVLIDDSLCETCETFECIGKCKKDRLKKVPKVSDDRLKKVPAITHPHMSDADKNAIFPRISFLNEKICKACGACSHTFYCDSFIDRANDELPPLMDSRNCSGCGLCVQVCSSGALQLYKPEEMLILISKSEERRDILRKLGIPFLAYDPEKDISNFAIFEPEFTERLSTMVADRPFEKPKEGNEQKSEKIDAEDLEKLMQAIWDIRLGENGNKKDEYLLSSDKQENINKDKRRQRRDACKQTAKNLLGRLETENITEHKLALSRAIIWSQLIWSDPGQIFWDSFIMTIQSYLCCDDTYIGETEIDDLISTDKDIIIANYVILLHKGSVILNELLNSKPFKISNFDKELLEKYKNSNFGEDRLADLDFRTSSEFLLENPEIPHSELLALAGLPWEGIRAKIQKTADEETIESFKKLLNAVARRTYN